MKKVIVLMMLIGMAVSAFGQKFVTIPEGITYSAPSDTLVVRNDKTTYMEFFSPQHYPATQAFLVKLDTIDDGQTAIAVWLMGKVFVDDTYVAFGDTVTWKSSGADTTIIIKNETANRYRYIKASFDGTGTGLSGVSEMELKQWFE